MIIDLHCHSVFSDGVLTPEALIDRAYQNGVTHLALTDHDQLGGLAEARAHASDLAIELIDGVEVSVEWQAKLDADPMSIHIVLLNIDPDCPSLQHGLAGIRAGRQQRGERIAADLAKVGIDNALAGALRFAAKPELISRSHFARYLVAAGYCRTIQQVFQRYLTPGKPGYVSHRWARIDEALSWCKDAGGVAVLAHPGRYNLSASGQKRLLETFISAGGQAIEVNSGSHTPAQMATFAQIAREYRLAASCGSDFHAPGESPVDLGKLPPLPNDLFAVWHLFSNRH